MSFMLVIVVIFFALVGMILVGFFMNNTKKEAEILKEQNARLLSSRIANSPELSCGGAYEENRMNCIDLDKVLVLKESSDKYKNFWDVDKLEIRKIYSEGGVGGEIECNRGNYPNCNIITLIKNDESPDRHGFVALCRKEKYNEKIVTKCELGIVVVGFK